MLDGSMSACAEANGVKVGDITNSASLAITNNFNVPAVDSAKPSLIAKAISSVRGALDPLGSARELAEARRLKAESDIEVYDLYRQNMPWLSERQAFLYANGFVTTPSQADNVFAVFEAAESKIESIDDANALPAPVLESVIDGAKRAYDDEVREMWSAVLAGEMESQGSFSKRTLDILSCMSAAEARNFKKLCSYSTSDSAGLAEVPIVRRDKGSTGSFNDRSILFIDLMELEAIGLYKSDAAFNIKIEPGDDLVLHTAKHTIRISPGDNATTFSIDGGSFTRYGVELSKLCEIGTVDGLEDLICEWASDRGLTSSIDNKTAWRP